ncbi:glycosyltransferase family 4 protein [Candidatus Saccharibacteria bacterium]|nr:glycosyltransferase family 4 protein [Candidatus Saccharibacteria bacterium]
MNILMLGWELPPHNSGGLGVACYHLAKALSIQGASIDFVVPYEAEHPEIDFMKIHPVAPITPLERNGLGAYDSHSVRNGRLSEADAGDLQDMRGVQKRYVQFVEDFVEKNDVDVIHAHDWLTMEAGVRAKELTDAPLIVHVHATEFDRSGELGGNPIVHEIEQQALLMADRIITVSGITKEIVTKNYGIPADRIEVVHNAIDTKSFDSSYLYDISTYQYIESLKQDGYTVVATITRFTVQKGLAHLMYAAKSVCDNYEKIVFLFAGDGEQRDELIDIAARLGISDRVFFTGFIRGKRWRDAYSVADIFVMSSVSEPFGLTALEAAHHDCALIISKQSGVGEILESIFRFDFWDTQLLADQILGLATSPALLHQMKTNIKNEYARISWNDVAKRCTEIYKNTKQGVIS